MTPPPDCPTAACTLGDVAVTGGGIEASGEYFLGLPLFRFPASPPLVFIPAVTATATGELFSPEPSPPPPVPVGSLEACVGVDVGGTVPVCFVGSSKMAPKGRLLHPRGPSRKSSSSTLIFSILINCLFFVLILLALGILSIPSNSNNSPKANDLSSIIQHVTNAGRSEGSDGKVDHWVEIISWEPRAVIYHNFLSKDECEYLINIAKPHMEKSTVVDSVTGKTKDSRMRTSSGTFLDRGRDETVRAIEKRIADFTFLPVEHGEGLQVLHYEVGQKYEPHYDFFLDDYNTKNGGQRMATVLMYLSDVEEGGETVFPFATGNISAVPWWNELSACGKKGLSVKPKMGDALLFWSMKPDATPDPSSLHGGCPVIKGDKWSSTKWIRVNEYKV